jgi:hypothetical protein
VPSGAAAVDVAREHRETGRNLLLHQRRVFELVEVLEAQQTGANQETARTWPGASP